VDHWLLQEPEPVCSPVSGFAAVPVPSGWESAVVVELVALKITNLFDRGYILLEGNNFCYKKSVL
jgi:hypothetical protein